MVKKRRKIVLCPNCRSSSHVYLTDRYERTASVMGGSLGLMGMICSMTSPQTQPIRLVFKAISAALAGASLGKSAGENIDNYVMPQYRCGKCNITIKPKGN